MKSINLQPVRPLVGLKLTPGMPAVISRKLSKKIAAGRLNVGPSTTEQSHVVNRCSRASRLAVVAFLGLGLTVGCGSKPEPASTVDVRELEIQMPAATHARAERSESTTGAQSATAIDSATTAQVPVSKEPSGLPVEQIETPPGKPEMRAELVPAPVGKPIEGDVQLAEPEAWDQWEEPQVMLFVTGNQHGYIEPCGCTGLENQKGGMARRFTLLKQVADKGWPIVPLDAGNQVRRTGRQSEVKFQAAATGLGDMNYQAVGLGPDDIRLGVGELIAVVATDNPEQGRFVSANVTLIDPTLMAQQKVIESGDRKIGVTSVLDPKAIEDGLSGDIQVAELKPSLEQSLVKLDEAGSDFNVLMFYGEEDAAKDLAKAVPGFDLIVVAGGYGEPTFQPEVIEGSEARMIVTGNKGMYVGLVGLYADKPFRYARVPLTHEYEDAPEMRRLMANYQQQLESLGLEGLGLRPIAHPSGDKFVGSATCGECHKTAYEIWENTPHVKATEDLVHPGERGDISRHFDPECLSCHVTGWNPQNYYPYESGYVALEASSHLHGNGCENCHGPGSAHVAAERDEAATDNAKRDQLRLAMQLPLEKAKDKCMECHDLDNSPDFHKEGAFEDYWAEVEHYGKD